MSRRTDVWTVFLAAAAALAVLLPGMGWGLPSEARLRLLLPDAAARSAVIAALAPAGGETVAVPERDPVDACIGPIDPGASGGEAAWMRSELVPFLMSSDDPDEMETFSSIGKVFVDRSQLDAGAFLYGHVYLAAVAAAEGAGLGLGILPRAPDRAALLADPRLLRRMYLLGRAVSVLSVAVLAASAALVMRRAEGGTLGVAAAVLGTLAPLAVAAAHVAKPHAFAAAFGFVAIALAFVAARKMAPGAWTAHALAAGIAASASPPHALLVLCAPAAVFAVRPRAPRSTWARCVAAWAGAGLLAVVILNPLAIAHPGLFLGEAQHHLGQGGWGYGRFGVAKLAGFLAEFTGQHLSPALLPLIVAGCVVCGIERRPLRTYVLTMTLCVIAVFGGFLGVPRIALLVVPLLALLAGFGADGLARASRPAWRAAGGVLASLLIAGLGLQAVAAVRSYRGPDPSELAGAWLNEHLPAERCVAVRADRPLASFVPRFDLLRHPIRRIPIDAPAPPGTGSELLLLTSLDPERDAAAPWFAPGGPYRVLARFPPSATGRALPGLAPGPHRPRSVVLLEPVAAGPGAVAGGG